MDELSITISASTVPSWHTRVVHDNFDDAFKTLDGLVDRRPTKITVLTWLGKIGNKFSESASTDNISDAIDALGQQRAAVERLTKPAHPFKVGDRVRFFNSTGVVHELVDDTQVLVRWNNNTHPKRALVERLHLETAEDVVRDYIPTFKVGDRVRWHLGQGSEGTVAESDHSTADDKTRIDWDGGDTCNETTRHLRLVDRKFKVGDRVGWTHESGPNALVGIVTEGTKQGHARVQWDTDESPKWEMVENLRKIPTKLKVGDRVVGKNSGRHGVVTTATTFVEVLWDNYASPSTADRDLLRKEETRIEIEPGDRVRSNVTSNFGTVLKPRSSTEAPRIAVRWDSGYVAWNVDLNDVALQS
jgi:co-chaperonin GroES (HSP10)